MSSPLYELLTPGGTADVETWTRALEAARREAAGEIQVLWHGATTLERRVLKVIAHRTVPLTGREAQERFGLGKSGSTGLAVDRLVGEGHLVADETTRTGWRVVDPFVAAWLREDG